MNRTTTQRLLVIDDDASLSRVIGYQLETSGFEVTVENTGADGIKAFQKQAFDIVVSDIQMPDISGIEVLGKIRKLDRNAIIILITAYGSVENAIEACHLGADDYLTKPFGNEQLLFVIEKASRLRQLQSENTQLRSELEGRYRIENFISESAAMDRVIEMTSQVADSDATTLIMGESGTGKEIIAKAIHYHSRRAKQPMITVNCPSIPDNLLESELFGHIRGAFTGALKDRKGKFELAEGGSIFLDEIGDLKESVQAKLLRVLQEHEVERLGESKTRKVDVRVIAATNKDLEQEVAAGKFREDLFYRLSVIPIQIPPLRDRSGDIPFLIKHFISQHAKDHQISLDADVMEVLEAYNWPGNVRELENLVQRLVTLTRDGRIKLSDLPENIRNPQPSGSNPFVFVPEGGVPLRHIEAEAIQQALQQAGGNQAKAARLLDIPRHVLLYRLKKWT